MFFSTELDHTLRHCSFCHKGFHIFLFGAIFCYLRVLCSYILKASITIEED